MKNLANCEPKEFLVQTNRIRKSVSKWLDDTDVLNIRKNAPKRTDDMSDEDYRKALEGQAKKNVNDMLAAIMEDHQDETLELLALLCFVEPEDVNNHTVAEYLASFNEILNNQAVVDFFISLMRLAN